MANNHTDNNVAIEPPPPGSTSSAYDGGADEHTPLISQQPKPINNFQAPGQNNQVLLREAPNDNIICPNCSRNITSKVEYRRPHLSCLCCLFNSAFCFIPLCAGGSKDIVHSCPNCHTDIGRYTRYRFR
ncbi:hypothetical protein RclHR1_00750015 [Rhizophagus clarus]|uniref:Lipopolysaccharide-induced tumor necrosis factor-alpha factor homolog isoform X1 n=1 Tax=Rhizophagus clarus TaxID=94130 RepID=A0A2Z6RYY6_9GLOM|nr:hypothetical protein RclHR1_00750015 [Rhizophagus clarus]GES85855.1 lipopolysaccharide-induced tumor necrosis factor-alpha factor homolog isoform X1 [Rhizophagus clarus]